MWTHLNGWLKQTPGPTTRVSDSGGLARRLRTCVLTSYQLNVMLLVWDHSLRTTALDAVATPWHISHVPGKSLLFGFQKHRHIQMNSNWSSFVLIKIPMLCILHSIQNIKSQNNADLKQTNNKKAFQSSFLWMIMAKSMWITGRLSKVFRIELTFTTDFVYRS